MAELNGGRIAAVFAADAEVDVRASLTAQFGSHLHELAHANLIKLGERIVLVNLLVIICAKELAGVVTAETEGHLG